MAKSAVKNPQSPTTTTKPRLSSWSCPHSASLLVVYLQKISITEGLLYFQEQGGGQGGKKIFPIGSVPIYPHCSSLTRDYEVLFTTEFIRKPFHFVFEHKEQKTKPRREKGAMTVFFPPLTKNTTKDGKKPRCLTLRPRTG